MNYGISILFRAIPLLMALFCFGYGAFVLDMGTDTNRFVAGPVVFSLGMICIALFATSGRTIQTALTPAPRTRLVRLDVRLQGADASSITAITARLEGVSRTARLEQRYTTVTTQTTAEAPTQTNSPAPSLRANANAHYYLLTNLQLEASTPTDPEATGTFRLLGTDSSATGQRILITATLADGTTLSYEQDVTPLFSGFNPPATATTLRLAATLNFGIDQVSGTIIPWTPGWNEGGTGL